MKIDNFVIGLGYDYDNQGAKDAESGLDSLVGKAKGLGAVLAGAFTVNGLKNLAFDFAERNDDFGKFSETIGVSASGVSALDAALQGFNGAPGEAISQLRTIADLRQEILSGQYRDAADVLGLSTAPIREATNSLEAYLVIADQLSKFDNAERVNAITKALGLSEASQLFLASGSENVRSTIDYFQEVRPITDEMTKNAAAFNDAVLLLEQNVGAVSDIIGNNLANSLTGFIGDVNKFFDENREAIGEVANNPFKAYARSNITTPFLPSDDDVFSVFDHAAAFLGSETAKENLRAQDLYEQSLENPTIYGGLNYSNGDFDDVPALAAPEVDPIEFSAVLNGHDPNETETLDPNIMSDMVPGPEALFQDIQAAQAPKIVIPEIVVKAVNDKVPIQNNIYLDGQQIKTIIDTHIRQMNAKVIEDIRSPVD
ncbi:hypothetical protein [Sessilibacter corallicola]|uniref:hypothetical protein n=1 Tax=Sessilibacter corallicola TaxID=2904075 RepID=UPI001E51AE8F|nr:hypothetical protein [Sessilibacter corallicola]MCE2029294.1 hypothetical protein [Sessilibacter corallicola]